MLHEGLVLLFRNCPTLAPELLRSALGVKLPAYTGVRIDSAELKGMFSTEFRADLLEVLLRPEPVEAIVVEVQLKRDERKLDSWPLYLTYFKCKVGCPTLLLVVAPRPGVARWAAQPLVVGHDTIRGPPVLGPHVMPVVTDKRQARRCPELAVLSAIMHGKEAVGLAVARAALHGIRHLPRARWCLYSDLIVSSLNEAARAAVEKGMYGKYRYQSELARKFYGQGQQDGLERGLEKGRREGRQEGRQEGQQKGEALAVLEVLDARGLSVSATARRRILGCTSPAQLKRWLRQAVTVTATNQLFGPRPACRPSAR